MATLALKFRLDELSQEGRPFKGALGLEIVSESVSGLVGKLGYRAREPLEIAGNVYRAPGGEVIVDATFTTKLGFDCVRCLESRELEIQTRVDHVIVEAPGEDQAERPDDEDDPDVYHYVGDQVDVSDMFREDLVLELPMNPHCVDAGFECIEQEKTESAQEATIDPRWAPLLEMKKKLNSRS